MREGRAKHTSRDVCPVKTQPVHLHSLIVFAGVLWVAKDPKLLHADILLSNAQADLRFCNITIDVQSDNSNRNAGYVNTVHQETASVHFLFTLPDS